MCIDLRTCDMCMGHACLVTWALEDYMWLLLCFGYCYLVISGPVLKDLLGYFFHYLNFSHC